MGRYVKCAHFLGNQCAHMSAPDPPQAVGAVAKMATVQAMERPDPALDRFVAACWAFRKEST